IMAPQLIETGDPWVGMLCHEFGFRVPDFEAVGVARLERNRSRFVCLYKITGTVPQCTCGDQGCEGESFIAAHASGVSSSGFQSPKDRYSTSVSRTLAP